MQKLVKYFLMSVMALFMYMPGVTKSVEAANMIVLPVVNNVDYPEIEGTYYDNVLDCFKQQDKYDYLDNDAIQATIDKYVGKGQMPTENALRGIAEECNADLVMCIELNHLSYEPVIPVRVDDIYLMRVEGNVASYNKETNKFVKRKIKVSDELDNGYNIRQNVPLRYWARTIQHEMHRVMNVKGLNIEKQKIQKF